MAHWFNEETLEGNFKCEFCGHLTKCYVEMRQKPEEEKGETVAQSNAPIDWKCPKCLAWISPEDEK